MLIHSRFFIRSLYRLPTTQSLHRVLVVVLLSLPGAGLSGVSEHWLQLPAGWIRGMEGDVVTAMPGDLSPGTSFLLLVETPGEVHTDPTLDYRDAIVDLGPWRPVGSGPVRERTGDWIITLGTGVATLEGVEYTALTAVARAGAMRARFWVLADSDATYNRHQGAVMAAIAGIADYGAVPSAPMEAAASNTTADAAASVYVGLERGLTSGSGGNAIVDRESVRVFFADGSYRRQLPVRGLASDLDWERRQQSSLWGTWHEEHDEVFVAGEGYQEVLRRSGSELVDDRGRALQLVTMPADLCLNGSYARADYRDAAAPRLVLRNDCTYTDADDFLRMIGSAWHLVVPDGDALLPGWSDAEARRMLGSSEGVYRFEKFTLHFTSTDGREWRINAYLPPVSRSPSGDRSWQLVVNGRLLLRD